MPETVSRRFVEGTAVVDCMANNSDPAVVGAEELRVGDPPPLCGVYPNPRFLPEAGEDANTEVPLCPTRCH